MSTTAQIAPSPSGLSRTSKLWIAATAAMWAIAIIVTIMVVREYNPFAKVPRMSDLRVYTGAAQWVLDGGRLYEFRVDGTGLPFTYPPFGVIAFLPTVGVSYTTMKVISLLWAGASVLAIAHLIPRHARIFTQPGNLLSRVPAYFATPVLAIALGLTTPVLFGTKLGQISLLLVAIITVDVLVICRRWPKWGGFLTGFAAALKLTPLAVIPALWLAGRRRQAYNGAGLFAVLSGIGIAIFPNDMVDYVLHKAGDLPRFGSYKGVTNQGVGALLMRMGLDGSVQKAIYLLLALVILIFAWRRAAQLLRAGDDFTALIVIGAAMVAASPISWTHHQVWLWMAMFVIVSRRTAVQVVWMLALGFIMTYAARAHITTYLGFAQIGWIDFIFANLRAVAAIVIAVAVPTVLLRWRSGTVPDDAANADAPRIAADDLGETAAR